MQKSINNHCITARTAKCSDAALSRATSASLQQQQPLGAAAVHCTTYWFKKRLIHSPFHKRRIVGQQQRNKCSRRNQWFNVKSKTTRLRPLAGGETWNNQTKKRT